MADFTFTLMKGRVAYYHGRVTGITAGTSGPETVAATAGATLIGVLLQQTSLEGDTSMQDKYTLASLLSTGTGTSIECTATNYSRYQFTPVAASPDFTGNTMTLDLDNASWTNLGTSGGAVGTSGPNNTIGKLLICYKPSGATDTTILPLTAHDFSVTATDGSTLTATVNAYYRAL